MKRFYVLFEGFVQGVGFRWTLVQLAHKHNLTGYCQNLSNGNVALEIQGKKESIDAFLNDVLSPHRYIQIYNYSLKEIPTVDESSFTVRY